MLSVEEEGVIACRDCRSTGHGRGFEIHEEPYIVRGNDTPLAAGMCFFNEPMIVFPKTFGIRLEDHICMTTEGRAGSLIRRRDRPSRSPERAPSHPLIG
ncbi:M24 family metallopeptidase [Rhizobium laguerreae]|nr:M24 family metallopeptidase [Rhizobium laguerreae]MBY3051134.1 M24 family metallopeptidase [Rhizobium laguerreae]MBY3156032.1 M24 family metallopeptidase [Rhizobium laguerreae]MBY3208958.1 M24 family metallopeptidase [Rhizobium laguerreae]